MTTPDLERLRESYRSMPDDELVRMALTAGNDLAPAAITVFREELAARRLVPELWPTLDLSPDSLSPEQLDELIRRVQFMPCPRCGGTRTSLNAYVTRHGPVIPLPGVLLTGCGFYIGCQPCLSGLGAWRLFKLKPGQRWKPSEALRQWVKGHAALLIHFAANDTAVAALLRFDYDGFLRSIRS